MLKRTTGPQQDSFTAAVIDDTPESREAVTTALARFGVAVLKHSGAYASSYPDVVAAQPGVVFVTVEEPMPRPLAAIEHLAAALADTPIVAVSSSTSVSHFQQVIRAGARYLIEAPVQQDELERVFSALTKKGQSADESRGRGRIVTVVGQKGGVGKTAISVNLAAALAQNPANEVLIIDFDLAFGDVGLAMNVDSPVTAAHVARQLTGVDMEDFRQSVVAHPSGAFVLGAPARVGEWLRVTPEQLESLVQTAAALYDYVIIDTPGAFNDAVAAAMELADNVLVVTSLELSSVKNTALLLEVLDTEGFDDARSLVVANCTSQDTGLGLLDLVPSLRRDSIWKVPFDPAVRKGSQIGQPVVAKDSRSPASLSIRALASRIETAPTGIDRRSKVRDEGATAPPMTMRERLKLALVRVGLPAA